MFCPSCGSELKDGARFCTNCGHGIGGSGQPDYVAPTSDQPAATRKRGVSKWLPVAIVGVFAAGLVLLLVSVMLPGGCSASKSGGVSVPSSPKVAKAGDSWTVLVYMCGSDLESQYGAATKNIEELLAVELPANAHVLLETGGAKSWRNELVDPTQLGRYVVENGDLSLIEHVGTAPMSNAGTLADFVSWGVKAYPADHFMLVFWDHGGGSLTGVCLDEQRGGSLTLPEIDEALTKAGTRMDVVGFDTCLMATLENAQMLARHADYLVASEETEPGGGWAWDAWPRWFKETEDGNPAGLGACIVDSYIEKCAVAGVSEEATLSVVNLTKTTPLADAFYRASEGMARSTERAGTLQKMSYAGRDAQSFGFASYLDGYTNMVDLGDLAFNAEETLGESRDALMQALRDAVVYERHGAYRSKSTGLSVFYPLAIDGDTFRAYHDLVEALDLEATPYLQYLAVRAGVYKDVDWKGQGIADLKPISKSDAVGAFSYTSEVTSDGRFTVHITGNTEYVKVATFALGMVLDDGTVATLGTDNNLDVKIDEHGQVDYKDRFDGGWLKIGGCFVHAEIVEMVADDEGPSYNLYSVPIELTAKNRDGKDVTITTNLLVAYDYKTNTYAAPCVYEDADETGMAGKTIRRMQPGDKVKFIAARTVDGKVQTGNTGTITWSKDTKVEWGYPGDHTYVYSVIITDIFDQAYPAENATITFKNGKRASTTAQ